MQYAVTLRENTPLGRTCFGFVPHSYLLTKEVIRDAETVPYSDLKEEALCVCSDGTNYNPFGYTDICRGDIREVTDEDINLWFDEDYVKIRSSDDKFECNLRYDGNDLIPWL